MTTAKKYTANKLNNLFIRAIASLDKSLAKIDYFAFSKSNLRFSQVVRQGATCGDYRFGITAFPTLRVARKYPSDFSSSSVTSQIASE